MGADHTEYGQIAVEQPAPGVAISISAGRFRKGYPHVDPNEDAALALIGEGVTLLAVADGHNGVSAAEAVIAGVEATAGSLGPGTPPQAIVHRMLAGAVAEVDARVPGLTAPRHRSRTALTVAAIVDRDVAVGSFGDTVALVQGRRRWRLLTTARPFIGPGTTVETAEVVQRSRVRGVMLLTDGITEFLGPTWQRRVAGFAEGRSAPELARALIEGAFAGAAGDNVAAAVALRP